VMVVLGVVVCVLSVMLPRSLATRPAQRLPGTVGPVPYGPAP